MIEFIRGAWTAERIILAPAARKTSSNAAVTGHTGLVTAVAVGALPDGTPVIVSGGDGTVRVWWLADGTPLAHPLDLSEPVEGIASRGNIIVTAAGQDISVHQLFASCPI